MPQTFAMEHEVGRVAVLVDDLAVLVPAGCAIGVVVTVPICAVAMNNAAAIIATHIIFIKAMLAERVRVILDGVFLVDPLGTVVADYGQAVGTILAVRLDGIVGQNIFGGKNGSVTCCDGYR